jgi:hypothetical protein
MCAVDVERIAEILLHSASGASAEDVEAATTLAVLRPCGNRCAWAVGTERNTPGWPRAMRIGPRSVFSRLVAEGLCGGSVRNFFFTDGIVRIAGASPAGRQVRQIKLPAEQASRERCLRALAGRSEARFVETCWSEGRGTELSSRGAQ